MKGPNFIGLMKCKSDFGKISRSMRYGVKSVDVLSGRGNGSNCHPGNILFRENIADGAYEYASPSSTPLTKKMVILNIIDKTHKRGGTFLDYKCNQWVCMSHHKIMRKVAQGLRDASNGTSIKNKKSKKTPRTTAPIIVEQNAAATRTHLRKNSRCTVTNSGGICSKSEQMLEPRTKWSTKTNKDYSEDRYTDNCLSNSTNTGICSKHNQLTQYYSQNMDESNLHRKSPEHKHRSAWSLRQCERNHISELKDELELEKIGYEVMTKIQNSKEFIEDQDNQTTNALKTSSVTTLDSIPKTNVIHNSSICDNIVESSLFSKDAPISPCVYKSLQELPPVSVIRFQCDPNILGSPMIEDNEDLDEFKTKDELEWKEIRDGVMAQIQNSKEFIEDQDNQTTNAFGTISVITLDSIPKTDATHNSSICDNIVESSLFSKDAPVSPCVYKSLQVPPPVSVIRFPCDPNILGSPMIEDNEDLDAFDNYLYFERNSSKIPLGKDLCMHDITMLNEINTISQNKHIPTKEEFVSQGSIGTFDIDEYI